MKKLLELKKQALELMEEHGFKIKEDINIEVDHKLPFMGYTTEKNGKTVIVVSGWSLRTDMTLGLVIHELGHVYRIETNHPSHNSKIHSKAVRGVFEGKTLFGYQNNAIYNVINNIQDLYADDIAFKVYLSGYKKHDLSSFFLGWIRPPVSPVTTTHDRWRNAEDLLSTSFAQANLQRHGIPDAGGKVEIGVKKFLDHVDPRLSAKYGYFKDLMVGLPEKITDVQFEKLLEQYLHEFAALTD